MTYTFGGGIRLEEHKNTRDKWVETMPAPKTVSIPLCRHAGAPAEPTVKVGDAVKIGQCIADTNGTLSCPVHASVSGKVIAIEERTTPTGETVPHVVIENDMEDALHSDVQPFEKPLSDTEPEEIVDIIKNAGITGMDAASFPTHEKLRAAIGKADKIIINCAQCEPFLHADHRLTLENPASVINGIKILIKALDVHKAYIAIGDDNAAAARKIKKLIRGSRMISVCMLKSKYPMGDERTLICSLTGRELPSEKSPLDVGCIVFNVQTCVAIYNAFAHGMPLVKRIVTVSGDAVKKPKNVLVPIGTSFSDVIDFAGGLKREPTKIIEGGPMTGQAVSHSNTPVTKGTTAILALSRRFEAPVGTPAACIRCGRCVKSCPMHLMPNYIAGFARKGEVAKAERFGAMACIECGVCSYVCPGRVEITNCIKTAKAEIKKLTETEE
ncbi:MAG: electron transport complex subunit RsxC [Clostridia bacterium]|nr:electron transport complex subunit RsxC [Clostridia bacterium]